MCSRFPLDHASPRRLRDFQLAERVDSHRARGHCPVLLEVPVKTCILAGMQATSKRVVLARAVGPASAQVRRSLAVALPLAEQEQLRDRPI